MQASDKGAQSLRAGAAEAGDDQILSVERVRSRSVRSGLLIAWALSRASNPTVLRLHTSLELTQETIETCPPSTLPHPLEQLIEIPGIRSIDLHRYRARLNLASGADPAAIRGQVCGLLEKEWGHSSSKRGDPARTFPVPYRGPRLVAESRRMAGSQPILRAFFGVPGVVEAILQPGQVKVRLGRLFSWTEVEDDVRRIIEGAK